VYRKRLEQLLLRVREGELDVEAAIERLRALPYEDLGYAAVDHHRALRKGFPEVVFCEGKTAAQVAEIVTRIAATSDVLATRATAEQYAAVAERLEDATYHDTARCITRRHPDSPHRDPGETGADPSPSRRRVLVVSAGTADLPVAEEAAVTAEMLGSRVTRLYDVGVAGIHRLLDRRETIDAADALVVVAGMDGVLASVVGGLVSRPVVAVPTSVGYGAGFDGIAPLLTMLNACAPGVAVVNIDNGFGGGYFAALIAS
jgi:NCAIR mutase (PurE)-related protein